MSTMIRNISRAATVLVAAGLVHSHAAAQVARSQGAPASATSLAAIAAQPKTTPAEWIITAQALAHAATLRAADDPRGTQELMAAATAYRIAGRVTMARRIALQAVARATLAGDDDGASHAYLAAASYSAELRDEAATRLYVYRSRMLADILTRGQPQPIYIARAASWVD